MFIFDFPKDQSLKKKMVYLIYINGNHNLEKKKKKKDVFPLFFMIRENNKQKKDVFPFFFMIHENNKQKKDVFFIAIEIPKNQRDVSFSTWNSLIHSSLIYGHFHSSQFLNY